MSGDKPCSSFTQEAYSLNQGQWARPSLLQVNKGLLAITTPVLLHNVYDCVCTAAAALSSCDRLSGLQMFAIQPLEETNVLTPGLESRLREKLELEHQSMQGGGSELWDAPGGDLCCRTTQQASAALHLSTPPVTGP